MPGVRRIQYPSGKEVGRVPVARCKRPATTTTVVMALQAKLQETIIIISINEDWRIASDPLQWLVQKRYGTDIVRWRTVAHCASLATSLVVLGERQVFSLEGEYPSTALKPLCHALTTIREDINRALAGFDGQVRACPSTACPMRRRDGAGSADPASSATPVPSENYIRT